jgi:uncharacterized membrane protein YgcG
LITSMLQSLSVPKGGHSGRRLLVACLGLALLAACSGRKVKEKLADKPYVKLALEAEPLKKVYGTRWVDPEPVMVRLTLRNRTNYIGDVLNRFIPAAVTEPGVVSPLAATVTYKPTGKAIPLQRYDDPARPVAADFITMEARYALTCEIDLKEYFPLMREPGAYTVQFHYRFGDREAENLRADKAFKKVVPWTGQVASNPITVYLMGIPEPTPTPTPVPTPTPQPKKSGEHGDAHGGGHGGGHGESSGHGASSGGGHAPADSGHGAAEPPKPVGIGSVIIPPPTPEPTPDPTPEPTPTPEAASGHGGGHGGGGHH